MFRHSIVRKVLSSVFIVGVTLVGFALYTNQVITHSAAPMIYQNPSQVSFNEAALVPHDPHSGSAQRFSLVSDLYNSGRIKYVLVCDDRLEQMLLAAKIPTIRMEHTCVDMLLKQEDLYRTKPVLVVATPKTLEETLFILHQSNLAATGLAIHTSNDQPTMATALERLRLYWQIRLQDAQPHIANPRYTLGIQH